MVSPSTVSAPTTPQVKVPLSRVFDKLVHTKDEVFYGVLRAFHRTEKRTHAEWQDLVDSYRNRPVKETH
jgi:hypothetical protein